MKRYRPKLVRPAEAPATEPLTLNLMLRKAQLPMFTGLQRSSIDRMIAEGRFPRPVLITGKSVAWLGSEVAQWQLDRKAERDAAHFGHQEAAE